MKSRKPFHIIWKKMRLWETWLCKEGIIKYELKFSFAQSSLSYQTMSLDVGEVLVSRVGHITCTLFSILSVNNLGCSPFKAKSTHSLHISPGKELNQREEKYRLQQQEGEKKQAFLNKSREWKGWVGASMHFISLSKWPSYRTEEDLGAYLCPCFSKWHS